MDTYKYQQEVKSTMRVKDFKQSLSFHALGIASRSGKTMELIQKYLYDDGSLDDDTFIDAMGHLLWDITALCNTLYIPIEDVINRSIGKMREEKDEAYTS